MSRPRLAALALACTLAPPGAAGAEFDDQRLFTTAAERARLDELRTARSEQPERKAETAEPARGTSAARSEPAPKPPPAPEVTLRGFVRRTDGPDAVWVNEGSTLGGLAGGIRVDSGRLDGDTVVIRLPDGRTVRLRPGQTWDPASGRVVDSYRAE